MALLPIVRKLDTAIFMIENCDNIFLVLFLITYDAWRNLVPFVQFKKREKHPWRNDTFSKVAVFYMFN